jgi:hypothetical protein
MAQIAPMLGAIMGISKEPKGNDKKRAVKPKTYGIKPGKQHRVTKGEKSATGHGQQHGELASYRKPTEHALMKERVKGSMRMATDDWVNGRIGAKEHSAIHARAKHVMSGRRPRDF